MPIPANVGRLDYDWAEVSDEYAKNTGSESLVQQHFKDEVDINSIVRRYGITAGMPVRADGAMYGDFTGISDYESAVALVESTRDRFMRLPAELREKFGNSPGALVQFAQNSTEEEFDAVFKPVSPEVNAVVAAATPVGSPVVP